MFEAEDIREWRGHGAADHEGHQTGVLEAVHVDTATDRPAFATVTTVEPARHRPVFAPLGDATAGPGCRKAAHGSKQVKGAPSTGTDGELLAEHQKWIFAHHEPACRKGAGGPRCLARR